MNNRFASFASSVIEMNRLFQKVKDVEMKKFGLKGNQVMCLYYLGHHKEGLIAAKLSELCREDKAAISRCLTQLHDKGLIESDLSEEKRSYRTVHRLTEKGKELTEKMLGKIDSIFSLAGSGMKEEERLSFYSAMSTITANLEKYLDGTLLLPKAEAK